MDSERTRRRLLSCAVGALTVSAGCLGGDGGTGTPETEGGTTTASDTGTTATDTDDSTPTATPTSPPPDVLADDVTGSVVGIEASGVEIVDHEISRRDGASGLVVVITTTKENVGESDTVGANHVLSADLYGPDDESLDLEFLGNGQIEGPLLLEPGDSAVVESTFQATPDTTVARYEVRAECGQGSTLTDPSPYC